MLLRSALIALAALAVGCSREAAPGDSAANNTPQLEAPTQNSEASRVFAAANDVARAATGVLTVAMTLRLPDAGATGADATEVLTMTGANSAVVEAEITGAVSPATQVQGQTLRALLNIPVEEPQVLVYRVTREARPSNNQGICGADAPAYVVVWEPVGPGEPVMRVLGVVGGAPGAQDARACPMLDYLRS